MCLGIAESILLRCAGRSIRRAYVPSVLHRRRTGSGVRGRGSANQCSANVRSARAILLRPGMLRRCWAWTYSAISFDGVAVRSAELGEVVLRGQLEQPADQGGQVATPGGVVEGPSMKWSSTWVCPRRPRPANWTLCPRRVATSSYFSSSGRAEKRLGALRFRRKCASAAARARARTAAGSSPGAVSRQARAATLAASTPRAFRRRRGCC